MHLIGPIDEGWSVDESYNFDVLGEDLCQPSLAADVGALHICSRTGLRGWGRSRVVVGDAENPRTATNNNNKGKQKTRELLNKSSKSKLIIKNKKRLRPGKNDRLDDITLDLVCPPGL